MLDAVKVGGHVDVSGCSPFGEETPQLNEQQRISKYAKGDSTEPCTALTLERVTIGDDLARLEYRAKGLLPPLAMTLTPRVATSRIPGLRRLSRLWI